MIAQEEQPGIDRPGDRRGESSRTGHRVEAFAPHVLDRRAGGSRPLSDEDAGRRLIGGVEQPDEVAARTVQMRLDHDQGQARRHGGVEGIAAPFQHGHSDCGGDPVR